VSTTLAYPVAEEGRRGSTTASALFCDQAGAGEVVDGGTRHMGAATELEACQEALVCVQTARQLLGEGVCLSV
jgi:hypothetical protein